MLEWRREDRPRGRADKSPRLHCVGIKNLRSVTARRMNKRVCGGRRWEGRDGGLAGIIAMTTAAIDAWMLIAGSTLFRFQHLCRATIEKRAHRIERRYVVPHRDLRQHAPARQIPCTCECRVLSQVFFEGFIEASMLNFSAYALEPSMPAECWSQSTRPVIEEMAQPPRKFAAASSSCSTGEPRVAFI